jgi:hypothetical protein
MKSTLAVIFAVFAAVASAAPTPTTTAADSTITTTVTVQLSNDATGANANKAVIADGTPLAIADLFAGTAVDNAGQIIATSVQLVQFIDNTFCVIKAGDDFVGVFNFEKTFADLDGNPDAAIPTDLNGTVLICEV